MGDISNPVEKKDHKVKTRGEAEYVSDMQFENLLYASFVRSEISSGAIKNIILPEIGEEYAFIGALDVEGENNLKVISCEQPIFANETVRYRGEAILMVVGPDEKIAKEYASKVRVEYEETKPIWSIDDASETAAEYSYHRGDVKKAFLEADEILEETFETGYQEQAYLEPQGCTAVYHDDVMTIYGSMQCPYYIRDAVAYTMGMPQDHVQIIQAVTGGGFGGKEDYPSLISCQAAVAAKKMNRPVRIVHGRREDMSVTPKRHPAKLSYQVAIDKEKNITAIKADIRLDAGAYPGLSSVVLQRALIAAIGVYNIYHLDISGKAVLTNLVPNGAYRGFGAPQSFFAVESLMNHIARKIGMTPLELREKYFAKQGDLTSTSGKYHHYVSIPKLVEKADELTSYKEKFADYEKEQKGRFRKGIGMSVFLHGCGFTGSAEKDFIKSKVKLVKYADDTVEIFASNSDIGQGLKTTFSKIVAQVLEIPLEQVKIENPDTFLVPNSGPTVASRSLMIVGKLLERAATKMKEQWVSGEPLEIMENYQHPYMIPWDLEKFSGDAYPTYSYGLNVVEVEVDTYTGQTKLLDVCGVFDVGKDIDKTIMIGQAQGGMLQGIGYGSMEKMENKQGTIWQNSFTDYMIPTSMDTVPNKIEFVDNPYEGGPFGAKGAGELTLIGTAPAYAAAVEQAIGKNVYRIPCTPEMIMSLL